jgi:hypothetical protein
MGEKHHLFCDWMNIWTKQCSFPSKGNLGQGEFKGSKTKEAAIYLCVRAQARMNYVKKKKKLLFINE